MERHHFLKLINMKTDLKEVIYVLETLYNEHLIAKETEKLLNQLKNEEKEQDKNLSLDRDRIYKEQTRDV